VWEAFETTYTAFLEWCQRAPNRPGLAGLTEVLNEAVPGHPQGTALAPGIPQPVLVKRQGLRRLSEELPPETIPLVLAEPPPARDAFLPLSYLWAGWLLGKEAAQTFAPERLLSASRPDQWGRYWQTMAAALRTLHRALTPQGRVVLVFRTGNLAQVRALILAATAGGLNLEQLLYQPLPQGESLGAPPYGGTPGWHILCFCKETAADRPQVPPIAASLAPQVRGVALQGARDVLCKRGEPSPFVWLHHAACLLLAQEGLLQAVARLREEGLSPLDFLEENIKKGLEEGIGRDLRQLPVSGHPPRPTANTVMIGASAAQPEQHVRLLWWLINPPTQVPLSDRVEEAVYQAFTNLSPATLSEIALAVHPLFPGLETPEPGLIEAVVASYGILKADGRYYLRQEDRLEQRLAERRDLISLLADLGHRLGFKVLASLPEQQPTTPCKPGARLSRRGEKGDASGACRESPNDELEGDVIWCKRGKPAYLFTVKWTARLHETLLQRRLPGRSLHRYLVIPEERVALIRYKITRQVLWQQVLAEDGWDFIKYQHLQRFAAGQPRLDDLEQIVGLAPPVEQYATQLPLF